jgi:Ca-activated chloride channel family protein
MNRVKCLFLLIMGLFSLQLQAQHTIHGIVMDSTKEVIIGASVTIKGSAVGTTTTEEGKFTLTLPAGNSILAFTYPGCMLQEISVGPKTDSITVIMKPNSKMMSEVVVTGPGINRQQRSLGYSVSTVTSKEISNSNTNFASALYGKAAGVKITTAPSTAGGQQKAKNNINISAPEPTDESYSAIHENDFQLVKDKPLSTFSIDVDRASYSNIRRYLNSGNLPPADAVRVEEIINYFDYHYKNPVGKDPVAIYTGMTVCPWEPSHQLLRIALKAKEIEQDLLPPANLVFLIDVSGSMYSDNKLPLVKQALVALVDQLRPKDKVAIVTYAGSVGVALPSTFGTEKGRIRDAINQLGAGGGTAGGAGIELAYETATSSFMENGNNRIIMATDGDFNVGVNSGNPY